MNERLARIYSRDRAYRSFIVFSENEFGEKVQHTKFISGNEYLEWPFHLLGWDVANKVQAGYLKVKIVE